MSTGDIAWLIVGSAAVLITAIICVTWCIVGRP